MPRIVHLPTAAAQLAEELDLVRWAITQGFCTHDSLAASMGMARSTVSMMLCGLRPGRFGLMRGLRLHLDADQYLDVLVEQARRQGIDPGDLLRARARQDTHRQAWAEVAGFVNAQLAEAQLAAAAESAVIPLRRPRRKSMTDPTRQLLLLKEAA
jgi:hypothetical protein